MSSSVTHRQQLTHQMELDTKKHRERIEREKDQRMAELEVKNPCPQLCGAWFNPLLPPLQAQRQRQEEETAHLRELKKLGVDLTELLVAQHPKPDQVSPTLIPLFLCKVLSLYLPSLVPTSHHSTPSLPVALFSLGVLYSKLSPSPSSGCASHHPRHWRREHTHSPVTFYFQLDNVLSPSEIDFNYDFGLHYCRLFLSCITFFL